MNHVLWAFHSLREKRFGGGAWPSPYPKSYPSTPEDSVLPYHQSTLQLVLLKWNQCRLIVKNVLTHWYFRKLPSMIRIKSFPRAIAWADDNLGLGAAKLLTREEPKTSGFAEQEPNLQSRARKTPSSTPKKSEPFQPALRPNTLCAKLLLTKNLVSYIYSCPFMKK